jgi:hypothetical protein
VALLGILIGLTPFLFWAGGLLAMIAIGLGIGATVRASNGAPRRTMAIAGTALGVLGLGATVGGFLLTGAVVDKIDERIDEAGIAIDDSAEWPVSPPPRPSAPPSASAVPGVTTPLPFGETYTYPDGIKVSLSAPKKYVTKNKYAKVGNAVEMTITITNGSTKNHNVIYAVPNVRDDKGMTAKLVFDGDAYKPVKGDILPGESASGVVAFEVPEGTTGLTADISPGTLLPATKFSGTIG